MATLTLDRPLPRGEDLPVEDDQALESEWHRLALNLLIHILCRHWQDRQDMYVAGNMFIYFDPEQATTRNFRGPDVFVVKGVSSKELRNSWVIWEEDGLGPCYVLELASPSTLKDDLGTKKTVYEQELKVPEYVVYDPASGRLRGWRLNAEGRYEELTPDERHWLWSEQLGLWLGKATYRFAQHASPTPVLRFFDVNGRQLLTEAEAQAQWANEQAQRAQAETKRADEQAQRAQAETKRADEEAAARQRLEAELARLQAQRHDRGGNTER